VDKSPEAFRTISEVAEALETPAHVLRFWESRFPQIRPVKRAGGRRYYRPADVALLTGIKRLLHDEGMTIRGVQKILREQGIRHVAGLPEDTSPEEEALEAAMAGRFDAEPALPADQAEEETAAALTAALDVAPAAKIVPFAPPVAEDVAEPLPEEQSATDRPDDAMSAEPAAAAITEAPPAAAMPPHEDAAPQGDLFVAPPAPPPESPPAQDDTATLAARLRALPRGSLAARHEDLAAIAARLTALRDKLGGQPPRA